jgi:hypothetical protein
MVIRRKFIAIITKACHMSTSRGRQIRSVLFTVYARVKGDFLFRTGVFKERKLKEFRKYYKNTNKVLKQILKISQEFTKRTEALNVLLVTIYQEMY